MIKTVTCHWAVCDECKNDFENGDFTPHYNSAAEALSEVESYDWDQLPDGRLVCDTCIDDMLKRGEIESNEDDDSPNAPRFRLVGTEPRAEATGQAELIEAQR